MRLISAHIKGYGRLVDAKINLDSKLIAIVGPNEAGKTTLLKALAHVDSSAALSLPERSRAADVPDSSPIVALTFILDDDDRSAVMELNLEEAPTKLIVSRKAGGGAIVVDIYPRPSKSLAPLRDSASYIRRIFRRDLRELLSNTLYDGSNSDEESQYVSRMATLTKDIEAILKGDKGSNAAESVAELANALLVETLEVNETPSLHDAIMDVISWSSREDPGPSARSILWGRSPDFLLFDEADRTLESVYTVDEALLQSIPAALKNVTTMAGLSLSDLFRYTQAGDIARRDTAVAQANARLDAAFIKSWKQSRLSVRFSTDGPLLRVAMWEDGNNITVFSERSAGLRAFVALIAFLRANPSDRPPVLLIDEAESHLHIDAQADLIDMFATQEQAVKVIYTTHSPACLPPDLGSGIRSIMPRSDNLQVSDIKNSFWQGAAGYSPLMLAMGAAAAAFTPARRVVLAEGATEMILLPSLLRAATGENSLDYQVAPGLSEVPKDFYANLDLEGAKVSYFLDGDDGGRIIEKGLVKAGVPKRLIVNLGAAGVENTLDPEYYREAIAALVGECNPSEAVPEVPELSDPLQGSWSKEIAEWIKSIKLKSPSKVAVANWLIENGKAKPSEVGAELLKSAHAALSQSFLSESSL